jgi:Family of unknown function (DUF6011)
MATMTATSITERQYTFIRELVETRIGRPLSDEEHVRLAMLSKYEAHDVINSELDRRDQSKKILAAAKVAGPVPDGRYAIRHEDGVVRFYKVNTPEDGKWKGRTFVEVQASDEFHPVRNHEQRGKILLVIKADPQTARVCGRTLTDEQSRADGIGPVCKTKMGW